MATCTGKVKKQIYALIFISFLLLQIFFKLQNPAKFTHILLIHAKKSNSQEKQNVSISYSSLALKYN